MSEKIRWCITAVPMVFVLATISSWFASDIEVFFHWICDDFPMICGWFSEDI
jgi:hypothetical protein